VAYGVIKQGQITPFLPRYIYYSLHIYFTWQLAGVSVTMLSNCK
jgi:hypothetical protein